MNAVNEVIRAAAMAAAVAIATVPAFAQDLAHLRYFHGAEGAQVLADPSLLDALRQGLGGELGPWSQSMVRAAPAVLIGERVLLVTGCNPRSCDTDRSLLAVDTDTGNVRVMRLAAGAVAPVGALGLEPMSVAAEQAIARWQIDAGLAELRARDPAAAGAALEGVLSEQERRDIQWGLQWTFHYNGLIDGAFGPGTRDAVSSYQESVGAAETGYLTASQMVDLLTEATARRTAAGFAPYTLAVPPFRIGVPENIFDQQSALPGGGIAFYSSRFDAELELRWHTGGVAQLADDYAATAADLAAEYEVPYAASRDDWFVLSGRNDLRYVYTRAETAAGWVVQFIYTFRRDDGPVMQPNVLAMVNTFELGGGPGDWGPFYAGPNYGPALGDDGQAVAAYPEAPPPTGLELLPGFAPPGQEPDGPDLPDLVDAGQGPDQGPDANQDDSPGSSLFRSPDDDAPAPPQQDSNSGPRVRGK